MANPQAYADLAVLAIKSAIAPLLERLAVVESKLSAMDDVLIRLVMVETKAAAPMAPVVDLNPIREQVKVLETTTVDRWVELRQRVEAVEARKMPEPVVQVVPDTSDLRDRLTVLETKLAIPDALAAPVAKAEAALTELAKEVVLLRERVAVVEVRPLVPGPMGEPGPPGKDGLNGKDGVPGLSVEGVYQEGKTYEHGNIVTWGGSGWHCNETTTTKPGEGSKAWTLFIKRGRDGRDGKDAETVPVVSVGGR